MPTPSLLCVHAHPDDEALATGGVLARLADESARTGVVTCTWAPDTQRAGELARSLEILGAGKPRMLGYADARVPDSAPGRARFVDAPLDEAVAAVVAHIREFRPEVVVTYDAYGVTGHEDHVHTHRVTLAAVEAAGYEQLYPDAGAPWRARSVYLVTLPRSLVAESWADVFGTPADPDQPLPGVPDSWITTTVDVAPWMERKWAAIHAHESEVRRGAGATLLTSLPEPVRDRLMATERYIRKDTSTPGAAPPGDDDLADRVRSS